MISSLFEEGNTLIRVSELKSKVIKFNLQGIELRSIKHPGVLTITICKHLLFKRVSAIGLRNRGVKDSIDLYVFNNTSMPALLVECAFVDSSSDMANYNPEKSPAEIYKGICTALAISENQQPSTNEEYYIVKYGDTLWGISTRLNTTVDKLVTLNSIANRNLINFR